MNVYLLPHYALDYKAPIEVWDPTQTGKDHLKHTKTFGCACYGHIYKHKKFRDKASKCIYLGEHSKKKGQRLYDLKKRKIISCRDVTYNEIAFPFREKDMVKERSTERHPSVIEVVQTYNPPDPEQQHDFGPPDPEQKHDFGPEGSDSDDELHDPLPDEGEISGPRRSGRNRELSSQAIRNIAGGNSIYITQEKSRVKAGVKIPETEAEAKSSKDWPMWKKAMDLEMEQIRENKTFAECQLPKDRKALPANGFSTLK
jgi:hypothetical protein